MAISFRTTKSEFNIITQISRRGEYLYKALGDEKPGWNLIMDVTACHANGCRLHLVQFLNGNELDFAHDIVGIYKHLNRKTGKLEDCFVPRFAESNHVSAEQ